MGDISTSPKTEMPEISTMGARQHQSPRYLVGEQYDETRFKKMIAYKHLKETAMNYLKKSIIRFTLIGACISIFTSPAYADQDLISLFPLNNYDQTISSWVKPNDPDYNKPLMDSGTQQKHLDLFYNHYFGEFSPWNSSYINQIFKQTSSNDLRSLIKKIIDSFNNQNKPYDQIGYGENFRPYSKNWIEQIENNINISQFNDLRYHSSQRGIAIDNLHARALPTEDVYLNSYKLAGQGYPFDILQISALWAGTPVYIIGTTRDQAWLLVVTPDYIGWVKSSGIARTTDAFVNKWEAASKNKLAAITHTQTSLTEEKGKFLFSAYVGSVFPAIETAEGLKLILPVADTDHYAVIKTTTVPHDYAALMPLPATPHHFADVMNTLIGRPYGWGSMYFYNDCSAELKSLLTPFGIWLPRHSSNQVTLGKMIDMTSYTPTQRLSWLRENGHKFLTVIYIGGHVVLYIGNYTNTNDHSLMAMTYQNIWGLSPNPPARRAVIGQSVLFPMLLQYSEDPSLMSLAAKKFFQVSYLDQLPDETYLLQSKMVNLKSLMDPDS